jgi:hypothetical protein
MEKEQEAHHTGWWGRLGASAQEPTISLCRMWGVAEGR